MRSRENRRCKSCRFACIIKDHRIKHQSFATICVRLYSPYKRLVTVRALLDQGPVFIFIIESFAQWLRLIRINRSVYLTSISEMQSVVRHAAQIMITPTYRDGPAYLTIALILRSMTKYLPNQYHV